MKEQYMYDAFISYRHLPLDEAVAARVQQRLEMYRPPRHKSIPEGARIRNIFRDKTELPTSGDLGDSLTQALLRSRFLIVILSEETKHSKWCMEEIRAFKEAHGGRIGHILPVLVSGDPQTAIPEILRYEDRKNDAGETVRVEVEPLCCDVRAESMKGSLKRLNTEFLRLAAPILGCGYDDLYQRHVRRSNRIKMAVIALLVMILGVISAFAWQTYVAQQRYERNLVDTYTRQGAEQILLGDTQRALMYYGNALELDPQDQAAKTGALLLLQQNNWFSETGEKQGILLNGKCVDQPAYAAAAAGPSAHQVLLRTRGGLVLSDSQSGETIDLSGYGEFLSSAEDGSCFTFADDQTITFYFTEDGAIRQVPRPTRINAACVSELQGLETEPVLTAMAVSLGRGVVNYGGYLYVYSFMDDGTAELFCEFDLAQVFADSLHKGTLFMPDDCYIDAGGRLVAVSDGVNTAVINAGFREEPLLNVVHVVFGMDLRSVVFSGDGGYYALIFGNDFGIDGYNPGGYFEVYDEFGRLCMASQFDPGVALTGAAFEPEGDRILVWGSAVLQAWNYKTGEMAAAPLQLRQVSGAAWADNGAVLVHEGGEEIGVYQLVSFTPAQEAPADVSAEPEQDKYAKEAVMGQDLLLTRTSMRIMLKNAQGEVLDEAAFETPEITDSLLINRMYADPASGTGYFWYDAKETLCRVTVDSEKKKITSAQMLNTNGQNVVGIHRAKDGAAVITGNGYLLYYTQESTEPAKTLQLGRSGIVKAAAADDSGLLAVILRSTDLIRQDSYQFNYRYTMELWDLNMGVRLGDLEDGKQTLSSPVFTDDGWLVYMKDGERIARLLDAEDPDAVSADYVSSVSCYRLNEAQYAETDPVDFVPEHAGNWNGCLTGAYITREASEDVAADETSIWQQMDDILEKEGAQAWLAYMDGLWAEIGQSDMTAGSLTGLFREYVKTARAQGLEDKLHAGFACVVDKLKACSQQEYLVHENYQLLFAQHMLSSDAYDDLMIEYWKACAADAEQNLDVNSPTWEIDLLTVYSHRVYASLLEGMREEAFYVSIDEAYREMFDYFLYGSGMDILYYLVCDDPQSAALSADALIASMRAMYSSRGEDEAQAADDVLMMMGDILMFCQRGVISREAASSFADCLSYVTGMKLTQISRANLDIGLRLGDIVTAVEGVRILNPQHLEELAEAYPQARLTVLRDGETLRTEPVKNWLLSGDYCVQ